MIHLEPNLLITTASAMVGLGITGENILGESMVAARMNAEHGGGPLPDYTGFSWNVAFIEYCGYWSHYHHKQRTSVWPIPPGMTPALLAHYGRCHRLLHESPQPGDVFLLQSPQTREFHHAGIVINVERSGRFSQRAAYHDIYAVEGDVSEDGQVGGGRTLRMQRRAWPHMGDRFLRWADMDRHDELITRANHIDAVTNRRRA